MKISYGFIQQEVEGKVELSVNGKPVKLELGDRVEVSVSPHFFKSNSKMPVAFLSTILANKKVVYRETQVLSGASGRVEKMLRNKPVSPALERTDEPEAADE